jgi:hypothetical protein
MGMAAIRGLYTHQDLLQLFRTDPLGALAQLEQRTGVTLSQVTAATLP